MPNITSTPAANPTIATHGFCRSTCGSSSIAAAANTTPAAKCCTPLVSFSPGRTVAAISPATAAATTGMSVYASTRTMRSTETGLDGCASPPEVPVSRGVRNGARPGRCSQRRWFAGMARRRAATAPRPLPHGLGRATRGASGRSTRRGSAGPGWPAVSMTVW
jgi:hypothetical protein